MDALLIDREWARAKTGERFTLIQPEALLDSWRDDGLHAPNVALRSYTLKHGRILSSAIESVFTDAGLRDESREQEPGQRSTNDDEPISVGAKRLSDCAGCAPCRRTEC